MSKVYHYSIRLNAFETGVLMGFLEKEKKTDGVFKNIYDQLVELKKQTEEADGVTKKLLPNGLIQLTDEDGITITRPLMEWERRELEKP